jgi:hypothetical protein
VPGLLYGSQAATADCGLAMIGANGSIQSAANGVLRWARALGSGPTGPQPVLGIGRQAIVQTGAGNPGGTAPLLSFHADSGRPAWQVGLPTLVQMAPLEVPGGLLLSAADPGCVFRLAGAAPFR